jgi:hypothetical protein
MICATFMMDDLSVTKANELIAEIYTNKCIQNEVDNVYDKFETFIKSAVEKNFKKKSNMRGKQKKGTRHSPKRCDMCYLQKIATLTRCDICYLQ